MEKSFLLTLSLLGLLSSVQAGLKILHPRELKNQFGSDGTVKASLGNFGHIQYGTSIVSHLYSFYNNFNNRWVDFTIQRAISTHAVSLTQLTSGKNSTMIKTTHSNQ
jgi:hypothetical protein